MKVVCHREGLLAACQTASAVSGARDVKPVLRNLKAVAENDELTLMATDLEIGIRVRIRGVKIEEPGDALLPTSSVVPILRESSDDEMIIEAGPEGCNIRGAHSEFEMPGEDPAAFPDVPDFSEEKRHEIVAGVLRDLIRKTLFSVATGEQLRYGATQGVLWEMEDDTVVLVATDGRRLAWAKGSAKAVDGHATKGQQLVVPAKAMAILERSLTEPDETIKVSFRTNEVLFKTERAVIYSRLVEGRFPNYNQVMPKSHEARATLTPGTFASAVRQAAIMTDDESKRVRFKFGKGELTLRAAGAESGKSKVELPIDYAGSTLEVNFDPKFVLEMLRVIEPDADLKLDLIDAVKPAVFRSGTNYQYLVVPLVDAAPATSPEQTEAGAKAGKK